MAWYSSWLPGLPGFNFAIPSSIQGRFLSFVLKKSLGHLLKPGQLDHHQIDSQIGSGYIQVNDLELSPQAINGYLDGLPLTLQSGTISSIKARIPWPNPLASTLGFSLKTLHLVFHVVPFINHTHDEGADLLASVTSVAESFMHQELSPGEEDTLWKSFHQEAVLHSSSPDLHIFPGGLDGSSSSPGETTHPFDSDPAGVSVFASLIERLLARFEFDAQDIKITLIHLGNISLTLSLDEIQYYTSGKNIPTARPSGDDSIGRESRTLSIAGLLLSSQNLKSSKVSSFLDTNVNEYPDSHTPGASKSPPRSLASSQSSLDDTTLFMMSQSLAALPPRPPSSTGSVSSSMYESAISNISSSHGHVETPMPILPPSEPEIGRDKQSTFAVANRLDEIIMSFGPQPISIQLTTPSSVETGDEDVDPFLQPGQPPASTGDHLHVSVSIGVVASAIRPWQVQSFLRLREALLPEGHPRNDAHIKNVSGAKLPRLKINGHVRGVVALLAPSSSDLVNDGLTLVAIKKFFEKPLVPPVLEHGCTRLYLDTLTVSVTISNETSSEPLLEREATPPEPGIKTVSFNILDCSVFVFNKTHEVSDSDDAHTSMMFPILLTDPHLISQYLRPHIHPQSNQSYPDLPVFDVINWTNERSRHFGTKLSQWRCQPPNPSRFKQSHSLHGTSGQSKETPPQPPGQSFFNLAYRSVYVPKDDSGGEEITENLDVQFAPLNIRVDLEYLLKPGGPLSFFEDLLPQTQDSDKNSFVSEETVDNDLYASTWNIALKDGVRGGSQFDTPLSPSSLKSKVKSGERANISRYRLIVNFPMIRLAIRSPPPQLEDRSGTLIIDLHDISVNMDSKPPKASARFVSEDTPRPRDIDFLDESTLLKVEFSRVVAACSMVGGHTATAFASIGPLSSDEPDGQQYLPSTGPGALKPRVYVIRPPSNHSRTGPVLALSLDIPAAHVDITKAEFDALQYWADDVNQLVERLAGSINNDSDPYIGDSRDESLIGSKFFVKSRSGSGSGTSTGTSDSAESVIKLTITEAFVRVMLPRTETDNVNETRPIEVKASDVDILVELNPDSKQQTILTLGVMDLIIENTDPQGSLQRFLSLTSPRSMSASPKSMVKLRFSTTTIPNLNTKETRIKLTLCGFTFSSFPNRHWITDMTLFAKTPPGTFAPVIPSDRTSISVKILDGSIRLLAPKYSGSIVSHIQELDFSTDVVAHSRDSSIHISATDLSILSIDDIHDQQLFDTRPVLGVSRWATAGYALVAEIIDLDSEVLNQPNSHPLWKVIIARIVLRLHLCADTLTAVTAFIQDLTSSLKIPDETGKPNVVDKGPTIVNQKPQKEGSTLMSSVEDLAFKRVPDVGHAPDMIYDDLPTNMDYLDESFGAAAGLRELRDDDLDEFDDGDIDGANASDDPSVVSRIGGETIKIFDPSGLEVAEDYFLNIPPEKSNGSAYGGDAVFSLRILDCNLALFLYDGYDWARTRRTIEEGVKEMRKRLAKIRQLVANGQIQDPAMEDTSALLYNSVHVGLDDDDDLLGEPSALIAAIDEELKDELDTASQSSWQSLKPASGGKPRVRSTRVHGKRLTRSKGPSMEFSLAGLQAEFDQFNPNDPLVSRTFVTVRDLEILDHIKTSTWKKFLTELRSDSRGNVRETDSNMVRIELRSVRPVPGDSSEEVRLRAKILPLRLYVDQDAVDFLKKFFSFKDPKHMAPETPSEEGEAYIQFAEIFPIDLKLDYKPRRVDYRALKEGKTIELMNFFHFDGAEMTLRHITLSGVTGWPRLFEMLNDLWTPDVKATQLVEVISGVAPIRSVVNVGSGVADLILLPIAQYKKDGRVVRGMQKGATAFVKSTAIEAIRMGAKLATGTQVILEQAEGVLGGQFENTMTAEPLPVPSGEDYNFDSEDEEVNPDLISKYAQQPTDLREGVQSAYKSLQKNLSSAAQTILAVPMEVYERSGNEGPVRSVIRAVPIAVLKPMIGASEAVSKTLLGLHNTLDPDIRHDNEAKYKLR